MALINQILFNNMVHLNIGGMKYSTSVEAIMKHPIRNWLNWCSRIWSESRKIKWNFHWLQWKMFELHFGALAYWCQAWPESGLLAKWWWHFEETGIGSGVLQITMIAAIDQKLLWWLQEGWKIHSTCILLSHSLQFL